MNHTGYNSNDTNSDTPINRGAAPFPVAGIGASAGGFEALTDFLENLPDDSGIAYVIIQHLSPNHESILPELLQKKTKMPVHKVENQMPVLENNVYVIPPDNYMSIVDGHLSLAKRIKKQGAFLPVDFFLKSLAYIYQNKAIGILLSGSASDGTAGFKEIKAEGGITFAQDSSALFSGMPKSAIDAGFVDFVLPADRIAGELSDILKLPYTSLPINQVQPDNEADIRRILIIMHHKKGVDFSLYKQTTVHRRVLRRMALNRKRTVDDYTQMLRENDVEVEQLYQDLLINVTTFFRDDLLFKALRDKVLRDLFNDRKQKEPLRIWVAGCATGEEAYSFAIMVYEYLESKNISIPFQIFATDLNEVAIEKARAGIYLAGNMENVSAKRVEKFFSKIDGSYQVIKQIRDVCVFATHNLLTDPPFSRMDIVSCQNVMIYFDQIAQKKILKAFNYALKRSGFLLLGKSESIGNFSDLFLQNDKESKVFSKKDVNTQVDFDFSFSRPNSYPLGAQETDNLNKENSKEFDLEKETDRLLLSNYIPASVVINQDMQILRFHGPTSKYLQPSFGKATLNLLKMVRDDLVFELRALIQKVKTEGISARKEGIILFKDGIKEELNLEVVLLRQTGNSTFFLIVFKEIAGVPLDEKFSKQVFSSDEKEELLLKLEKELKETRDVVRTMSEEFQATREELQSANEEVLSSNEELQSMNEELETSKEELQSTNEELTTINEELYHRNADLKEAFDFREAIVETIREPLLVLSTDLRVKTANRAFYENFLQKQNETEGLYLSEMGNGQWNIAKLKDQLIEIISKETKFQNFEVKHKFPVLGERIILFSAMRMVFEERKKNRILLVLEDITLRRKAEEALKGSLKLNTSILNSISDIFISVDNNWIVSFLNNQAKEFIDKKHDEFVGRNLWEVLIDSIGSDFHKNLIYAMKTKAFAQFEFYAQQKKEWFHFRIYPSEVGLSIYANNITQEKLSQEIIKQSKERYETFISETTEGILRFELKEPVSINLPEEQQVKGIFKNAVVAEANNAIAKMFGFSSSQQIIGLSIDKLISLNKKNQESVMEFIRSGYRLSDLENSEINNGETKYFLNNIVAIIENNNIVRIWGTQRDVTDQKNAEKDLIKTRNQLDFSLAAGSVGTFTWNLVTDKITWTKVQAQLYQIKEDAFHGSIEEWYQFLVPEDVPLVKTAVKESVEKRKELSVEFRITWPDKSIHWIMCRAKVFYNPEGVAIEMSGINIDISERKFKEQEKEENEERFRALVQNSFDVITIFNYDGTITYQSDSLEKVLGYKAEKRIGKNIFTDSIVHPDDRETEKKLFERCVHTPYVYLRSEYRMEHKDGGYNIMEVGCINLANNSSIHGIIKFYRDITERRMIEKQKEEFIAVASHELKTPVTSIKAYTQILYETLREKHDNSSADLLLKMDSQIDRLTTLITDLLDVTKITEGQLSLKHEEYDLNDLIKEVVDEMQLTTKKHEIQMHLDGTKTLKGDRERTSQVLINLLSNAIKYSPQANRINVSSKVSDREVQICVQDFGIGITKEMQKKLFSRFFRVSDEVTSTFPGLGLGLYICSEIIKNQNGRIWVESTPKGGSVFCFSLPLI